MVEGIENSLNGSRKQLARRLNRTHPLMITTELEETDRT